MKRSQIIVVLVLVGLGLGQALAQVPGQIRRAATGQLATSPEEVVNFKSDVQLSEVFPSLFDLWKKFRGKPVIDRAGVKNLTSPIGIDIVKMHWKDAFEMLLRQNNYWYRELDDYVEVLTPEQLNEQPAGLEQQVTSPTLQQQQTMTVPGQQPAMQPTMQGQQQMMSEKVDSAEAIASEREIMISSVFFEVDKTALAQSGVSFSLLRGRGLDLSIEFSGADRIATPILEGRLTPSDPTLPLTIDAAIRMFESEQLGEEIARPQVIVRSGTSAKFMSGQEFSVKQLDFSGNTTERFYQTGTILTVTPKYYEYEGTQFILLTYAIQRSSATPGAVTTLVDKVETSGTIALLDGEETYVGGLYSTNETTVREGIPFLKDLPWWVFGLRYLFGYDSKNVSKKELIVLLKAELVPTLKDRDNGKQVNVLRETQKKMLEDQARRKK